MQKQLKLVVGLAVCLSAACSETPTQIKPDTHRQMSSVIGEHGTWLLQSQIYNSISAEFPQDAVVKLTLSFTLTSDDQIPGDCDGWYEADATFKYVVNGVTYTHGAPARISVTGQCGWGPWVQLLLSDEHGYPNLFVNLYGMNQTDAVPLTLVAKEDYVGGFHHYVFNETGTIVGGFDSVIFRSVGSPANKDACKNNGWMQFGFRNQGLCVSYVETGKDTR